VHHQAAPIMATVASCHGQALVMHQAFGRFGEDLVVANFEYVRIVLYPHNNLGKYGFQFD